MVTKGEILQHEANHGKRSIELRRQYNHNLIAGGKHMSEKELYNILENFHANNSSNSRYWKNRRANAITNTNVKKNSIVGSFSGQLGFVGVWTDPNAMCSRLTRSKQGSTLCRILSKYMRQRHPDFHFTSICVNRNWPGVLHVDKNNLGPSKMLTVGSEKMSGGDLYVHELSGGGKIFKTKNRLISFNGNNPHMTLPYTGTRYSIVYYTTSEGIKPERRQEIKKLFYINPPRSRPYVPAKKRKQEPSKIRMERAVKDLKLNYPSLYRTYKKRQGGDHAAIGVKYRRDFEGFRARAAKYKEKMRKLKKKK